MHGNAVDLVNLIGTEEAGTNPGSDSGKPQWLYLAT